MKEKVDSCLNCKTLHKLYKNLNKEEIEQLNSNRLEVVYNVGEIIFKQGTPITHIASIKKGLAKIYIEGYNKKNLTLQYSKSGEFFGGPGAFIDNIHHFSAVAVEETIACLINIDLFKNIMHKNIDFAFSYIEDISSKGIYNFKRFISLTQKQMHGRVAEALLYLNDIVYDNPPDGFPINRKEIAELTSLSKDSAGRILNSLHISKLIDLKENFVKILDRQQIEQISLKG